MGAPMDLRQNVVSVTANYTVQPTDAVILCQPSGGAFTVTLPTPATGSESSGVGAGSSVIAQNNVGQTITIRSTGTTNAVTIAPGASVAIDGTTGNNTTYLASGAFHSVVLVTDGANWFSAAKF